MVRKFVVVSLVILLALAGIFPVATAEAANGAGDQVAIQQSTHSQVTTSTDEALGSLRAGAARIDITPDPFAADPPLNEYELEKLFVRAIVLDDGATKLVLLGADLSGIDEPIYQDIKDRIVELLDIPASNIIVTPTHIHSDQPPGWDRAANGRYASAFLADVMVDAVNQAVANLEPVKVGYNTGYADLNVNRDALSAGNKWTQAANFDAPADKEVAVLSFIGEDNIPVAIYTTYAMHPVNGYLTDFVSADFAGAMERYVEMSFGDDTVTIFSQNASGDVNPRWLRVGTNTLANRSEVDVLGYEMIREEVEAPMRNGEVTISPATPDAKRALAAYEHALGVILGEEVIRVVSTTDKWLTDAEIWSAQQDLVFPGRTRLDNVREGSPGEYEEGDDVNMRIGVVALGDIALATVNAEVYTNIGLRVKEESPLAKTMVVTIANGKTNGGYIPDDESFGHYTFQVLGSRVQPGYAEDGIVDGVTSMIDDYLAR